MHEEWTTSDVLSFIAHPCGETIGLKTALSTRQGFSQERSRLGGCLIIWSPAGGLMVMGLTEKE
jgi:hypothetical protein